EGVQMPAHRLEAQGQLVGVAGVRALEHHVLEEVRHPRLHRRLVPRADANPDADRDRAHGLHVLPDEREPRWKDDFLNAVALRLPHGNLRYQNGGPVGPPRQLRTWPAALPRYRRECSGRRPRSRPPPPEGRSRGGGSPPSGSTYPGSACLRLSLILPSRSIPITLTRTVSPSLITSSTRSTRLGSSSEMWTRPSLPGEISTKAPNGTTRRTVPE